MVRLSTILPPILALVPLLAVTAASTCSCPSVRGNQVCGSDFVTYPSICHLRCVPGVRPIRDGPCGPIERTLAVLSNSSFVATSSVAAATKLGSLRGPADDIEELMALQLCIMGEKKCLDESKTGPCQKDVADPPKCKLNCACSCYKYKGNDSNSTVVGQCIVTDCADSAKACYEKCNKVDAACQAQCTLNLAACACLCNSKGTGGGGSTALHPSWAVAVGMLALWVLDRTA